MLLQNNSCIWKTILENMAFHYTNDVLEVNVDTKNTDKIDVQIALNSGKILRLNPNIKDSIVKVRADVCHALIGR
jgi:hypothetical protein